MSKASTDLIGNLLVYEPKSGVITWSDKHSNPRWRGKRAGYIRPDGYRMIEIDCRPYYAHRLAWYLHYGKWPEHTIDHRNRRRDDNRILNLRDVSQSANNFNSSKTLPSTGERFIWHNRNRYQVTVNKRYLGKFSSLSDAVAARDKYLSISKEY